MIDLTVGASTPIPVLSVNPSGTDTPTNEYAITLSGVAAADGLGHELVGADADGVFDPADFGITSGQAFCITPVSYNIAQVRHMLDSILLNSSLCCPTLDLVSEGFCDTLNMLGFASGSDVQDLNDVYQVIRLFSSDSTISLEGFVFRISEVNNAGGILPESCGGSAFPICYAVKSPFAQQCYQYGPSGMGEGLMEVQVDMVRSQEGIFVRFVSSRSCMASVTVTDLMGRTLSAADIRVEQGNSQSALNSIEHGVIIVRVEWPGNFRHFRVVSL